MYHNFIIHSSAKVFLGCFQFLTVMNRFTHSLYKAFKHIHKRYFEILIYTSAILYFSGPTVVVLLESGGGILSWMLLIVF